MPACEAAILLTDHHRGGHRDDGQPGARLFPLADRSRGGVPVEPRHLAVHQHGDEPLRATEVTAETASLPVLGELHLEPEALEHAAGDQLVHGVVLGHEDGATSRATASRALSVEHAAASLHLTSARRCASSKEAVNQNVVPRSDLAR